MGWPPKSAFMAHPRSGGSSAARRGFRGGNLVGFGKSRSANQGHGRTRKRGRRDLAPAPVRPGDDATRIPTAALFVLPANVEESARGAMVDPPQNAISAAVGFPDFRRRDRVHGEKRWVTTGGRSPQSACPPRWRHPQPCPPLPNGGMTRPPTRCNEPCSR